MHVGAPTESPAAAIGFRDPRHPVPAIDAPRLPVTEGTMTVLHADLKDGAERPLSRSLEPQRRRNDNRRDPNPDQIGEFALRCRNRKGLVRRPDQPASEGDALDFIAVKKRVRSAAEKRGLQLPGEIDGVADA